MHMHEGTTQTILTECTCKCSCVMFNFLHRVVKQTLRSSGANVTTAHITEVSLAALFLLEAAKKTDREFGVTTQSQRHTVRDAAVDVQKIVQHLLEKSVTTETQGRHSPKFIHPTNAGWVKMSSPNWLAAVLSSSLLEDEYRPRGEVEYELSNIH